MAILDDLTIRVDGESIIYLRNGSYTEEIFRINRESKGTLGKKGYRDKISIEDSFIAKRKGRIFRYTSEQTTNPERANVGSIDIETIHREIHVFRSLHYLGKSFKPSRFSQFQKRVEMKTAVILCGSYNAGKTKTLKKFFGVSHIGKLKRMQLLERVLDGRKIYAISLSSPQELSDFCVVDQVKEKIEKRIQKCEQEGQSQDYFLIIPFTLMVKGGEINERCIVEPIQWLKAKGFKVVSIYLRRENTRYLSLKDALMRKITSKIIESKEGDYDRQSRELEDILRSL